jgi:hypothetical protein
MFWCKYACVFICEFCTYISASGSWQLTVALLVIYFKESVSVITVWLRISATSHNVMYMAEYFLFSVLILGHLLILDFIMGSSSFFQCHKYIEFEFLIFSLRQSYWLRGCFSYNILIFTNKYNITCIFLKSHFIQHKCWLVQAYIHQNISAVPKVYICFWIL